MSLHIRPKGLPILGSAPRSTIERVDGDREDSNGWQIATSDYRDRAMEIAQSCPGYAGTQLRHETRELLVFGRGEPTPAMRALIDQTSDDLRVSWHPSPYSLAELTDEVKRIMYAQQSRIHSGGARHDGTGMTFTTTDRSLMEAHDPQAALGSRYPVTIEYGEPAVPI
jgi:hypothetical protein